MLMSATDQQKTCTESCTEKILYKKLGLLCDFKERENTKVSIEKTCIF